MTKTCPACGAQYAASWSGRIYCSRTCSQSARTSARNSNWRGGKTKHPLYLIYCDMVARCTRPTHLRWADYGGRGITVCDRWRNDFWAFVSDMGPRPEGRTPGGRAAWTLDRVDNDRGYEPGNCRWADGSTQAKNRRRYGYEQRERNELGQFKGSVA